MAEVRHDRGELADEVTGEVDAVDSKINNRRAAGEMKVVAVAGRRRVAVPALGVDRPEAMDPADEAIGDQRLRDFDLAPKALVEADLKNDLRVLAGLDHPRRRGDVHGQRLLAEDMLAA